MLTILSQLKEKQLIQASDYYFAKLIADKQQNLDYSPQVKNLAILLAALCSFHYQQGHTCLKLANFAFKNIFNLPYVERGYLDEIKDKIENLAISKWQELLIDHIAFTQDPVHEAKPLVLQNNRLYFYRIWQDEYRIAEFLIQTMQQKENQSVSLEKTQMILQKYFPAEYEDNSLQQTHNWQKIAVATAIHQPFCVVTGGPGTGKTTTVTRLLLALQELAEGKLIIRLVAPTGKASDRLKISMQNSFNLLTEKEHIHVSEQIKNAIPFNAETIHSLIGVRFFEEKTKYNKRNPLPIDLLVVDEASMVDLSLMAKLLQALKPTCRLILLGDKDQLSSVEAGAILAELGTFRQYPISSKLADYLQQTTEEKLESQANKNLIRDCLCNLEGSRRFGKHIYIGKLAKLINQQQSAASWQLFEQYQQENTGKENAEINLIDFAAEYAKGSTDEQSSKHHYAQYCAELVVQSAVQNYAKYLQLIQKITENNLPIKSHIADIFAAFNKVRFLTALRVGELGSENLNQLIAERLRQKGLVQFNHSRDFYLGKPIIITENNSRLGLANGDIALYLTEKQHDGSEKGYFWFENGKAELASRIPNHSPAFTMTIHKSQGSEFAHTFVILPSEPNPVLCKELVYTGVTRAINQVTVFSDQKVWNIAVNKATERQSGLGEVLEKLMAH
ncbi:DNA helicase/exodeoxyribonuclease V subunit alpha [Canicola haemoglobinophilus]|uniref:RecBCD enzyme subunit RecD n=1 Tax=Canicola haemoglobinophilus TaxID=733 RepID=A0AB38H808_9PAST|nr:exodeoxyribonuclease V subunit alpha [Canicola haemoglobinophilus]STO53859.1 DNA helicase/exodeoxyribonuclease V subunit alpha [Canicola haemoglobinophilus]STO68392.1 DNA helicase/exodeoxyribonuclease V subunit alpha [Canicola haemoglobinophilus]